MTEVAIVPILYPSYADHYCYVQLFSMIFRLKNLQCTEGSLRGLVAFESRPENHKLKSVRQVPIRLFDFRFLKR